MTTYGITSNGFNRKTFDLIKSDLEAKWKEKLGKDQDLSEDSPNAMIIGLVSSMADELWQVGEDAYNSLNRNSAEGVSLENTVALIGMEKEDETASTANVSFKGDNGSVIPLTTQVKQSSTGLIFETIAAGLITSDSCNLIQFQINTIANSTAYRLYIDGNVYTYTSDGSATYAEIIAGLKVVVEGAALGLTITDNGSGLMTIQATDPDDSYDISASSYLTVGKVRSVLEVQCTTTGANQIAVDSINELSESLAGVDSVSNLSAGKTGRAIETDQELRLRSQTDKAVAGFNFTDAIKAKISDEVAGVSYCRVYENDSMTTDSNSINAKSYEAVVEGGIDSVIADLLAKMKVAGISQSGSTSQSVKDSDNIPHTIKFTRPTNSYLWVKVTIDSYNSEENFPANGEAAIKQAVLEFANSSKFNIGDTIVLQKFLTPVFEVNGIGSATITMAQTAAVDDAPSYGSSNINLTIRQKPNFDLTRISVVL